MKQSPNRKTRHVAKRKETVIFCSTEMRLTSNEREYQRATDPTPKTCAYAGKVECKCNIKNTTTTNLSSAHIIINKESLFCLVDSTKYNVNLALALFSYYWIVVHSFFWFDGKNKSLLV